MTVINDDDVVIACGSAMPVAFEPPQPPAWGKLTDLDNVVFPLREDSYSIGRSRRCKINPSTTSDTAGPRMTISGHHFDIKRRGDSVELVVKSNNGVVMNLNEKLSKDSRRALEDGDVILIGYNGSRPSDLFGYRFHLSGKRPEKKCDRKVQKPRKAAAAAKEAIRSENNSQPAPIVTRRPSIRKKKLLNVIESDEDDEAAWSLIPIAAAKPKPVQTQSTSDSLQITATVEEVVSVVATSKLPEPVVKRPSNSGGVPADFICGVCKQLIRDAHSTQPCSHTFCKECITTNSNCVVCGKKIKGKLINIALRSLIDSYAKN